eukprot:jgi/Hompol1/740/HPOL_005399-RA
MRQEPSRVPGRALSTAVTSPVTLHTYLFGGFAIRPRYAEFQDPSLRRNIFESGDTNDLWRVIEYKERDPAPVDQMVDVGSLDLSIGPKPDDGADSVDAEPDGDQIDGQESTMDQSLWTTDQSAHRQHRKQLRSRFQSVQGLSQQSHPEPIEDNPTKTSLNIQTSHDDVSVAQNSDEDMRSDEDNDNGEVGDKMCDDDDTASESPLKVDTPLKSGPKTSQFVSSSTRINLSLVSGTIAVLLLSTFIIEFFLLT